ncbi:MAG: hypothetical protein GVY32_11100 [Gammaproteobacteria bacterium]|jgi:hypothetical protein|nr:hypothetical protein [Gammaproteobacteria bacterium]
MRRKFPFLSLLVLALVGLSKTAAAEDCYDDVCVDFRDVGGYYLLTVTDVDDGSLLEVQMTDIPSSIPPESGGAPPTQQNSSGPSDDGPILNGPSDEIARKIIYTDHGADGAWIDNITPTYDGGGNLTDVDAEVVYQPHQDERQ